MAQAMKGVTKAMGNMNKQMKLPEIQKIMMEFEKQSEIMDMKGEMMEDAIGNSLFVCALGGSIFKNLEFATPRETPTVGVPSELTCDMSARSRGCGN